MKINRLFIQNFRIISELQLNLSHGLNLFIGDNGAGKTSILEAAHLLSLGKSFRQGRASSFIQRNQNFVMVGATLSNEDGKTSHNTMGVRIENCNVLYKLNGTRVRNITPLSESLPVIGYDPSTAGSIISDSSARRRVIDWGCFHSDISFIRKWRSYKRALAQRNSLLKSNSSKSLILAWDKELAPLAKELSNSRKVYLSHLEDEFQILVQKLDLGFSISFPFKPGWSLDKSEGFEKQLESSLSTDIRRGFTRLGPHRDDFILQINGNPLSVFGSRGQIKIAVLLLKIAQASLLQKKSIRKTLLLLDDLPSELDNGKLESILGIIKKLETQVLLSSIEFSSIEKLLSTNCKVFHVEHGKIKRESFFRCST